ncbi:hypothetical protein CR513_53220, partial [Mucuna pruriens]
MEKLKPRKASTLVGPCSVLTAGIYEGLGIRSLRTINEASMLKLSWELAHIPLVPSDDKVVWSKSNSALLSFKESYLFLNEKTVFLGQAHMAQNKCRFENVEILFNLARSQIIVAVLHTGNLSHGAMANSVGELSIKSSQLQDIPVELRLLPK